ncbi:hypothetical protein AKJ09_06245 [Labilithrix luteola]|uniref:Uncharacterized protein n=1 Tax=Labilithrix luteola TaxID=1391654 RepID=A0A0K1Q1Q5_9BACT|nr:hypothetical protein [Labilithrix luteola]AKU99581.1 hypothetical protein AKJ09_06245 [Labilithrix luteola]
MNAPKQPRPWWKVLLYVVGGFLLLLGFIIAGAVMWLNSNKERLLAKADETRREAETFAQQTDQSGCVDEGVRRASACVGILCEANVNVFISACSQHAKPTPGLCEKFPATDKVVDSALWAVDECKRRGFAGNERCGRVLGNAARTLCPSSKN